RAHGYPPPWAPSVFKLTQEGVLTTLAPRLSDVRLGSVVFGNDATLYGAASAPCEGFGCDSILNRILKLTADGETTTLAEFYGVANAPLGSDAGGMVFRVTANDQFTPLAVLSRASGSGPQHLLFGQDGNLYGTTSRGGLAGGGTFFRVALPHLSSSAELPGG